MDVSDAEVHIFNPGSPTDRRRQPHGTLGVLEIEDGRLVSTQIIDVT
jgi:predicted phosphodiesterase